MPPSNSFSLATDNDDVDLYATLHISKSASASDIRKAYRNLALLYHPDKCPAQSSSSSPASAEATAAQRTEQFQKISTAYAILSDEKKRERYDRTGMVEPDFLEDIARGDWNAYFKELWTGVVNAKTIDEFAAKYKNSEEEKDDVLKAYQQHKGDMDGILSEVPLSSVDDEDRFIEIIQAAVQSKAVKLYKAFAPQTAEKARHARRKAAEEEAKEAEQLAAQLGLDKKLAGKDGDGGEEALRALMMKRGEKRMNALVASLEEKYGGQAKTKKKSRKGGKDTGQEQPLPSEPSEEEFQALQAKLFTNKP